MQFCILYYYILVVIQIYNFPTASKSSAYSFYFTSLTKFTDLFFHPS